MQRREITVFDLLVNDRGEVLLALPDQGAAVADDARPRYAFEGDALVLRHADGRTFLCRDIDAETRALVAAAPAMVVTEGEGERLVRVYEAVNAHAPAGRGR